MQRILQLAKLEPSPGQYEPKARDSILWDLGTAREQVEEIRSICRGKRLDESISKGFRERGTQLDKIISLVSETRHFRGGLVNRQVTSGTESSSELRERTGALLSQLSNLETLMNDRYDPHPERRLRRLLSLKRASKRQSRDTSDVPPEAGEELKQALALLRRDLDQMEEFAFIMADANADAAKMHDEYLETERITHFLSEILGDYRSYHSLDNSELARRVTLPSASVHGGPFADIDRWLDGEKPVFLLSGDSGAGKTSLAYQFCVHLHSTQQTPPKLGSSFFFGRRDTEDPEVITLFLSTLAYHARHDMRSDTLDAIRECLQHGAELRNEELRLLLRETFASTPASMRTRTVLVIDGLDRGNSTKTTLSLLHHLLTWVSEFPWLYLFLTLRPDAYIMAAFARGGFSHLVHERRLEVAPRVGAHPNPRTSFAVVLSRDAAGQPIPLDAFYHRILKWGYQHKGTKRVFLVLECVAVEDIASLSLECIVAYANAHPAYLTAPLTFLDIVGTVHRLRSVLVMNAQSEVRARDRSFRDFLLDGRRFADRAQLASRPLTLASVCLAMVHNAKNVDAMLRLCPYPPPSPPSHRQRRPSIARHALFLWPRYVHEVACGAPRDKMLTRQLEAFVPSIQLALYAWVTSPRQALHAGKALMRYFLPCGPSGATICAHFFKFVSFVHICRDPQLPPHSSIGPAYLIQAIRRIFQGEDGGKAGRAVAKQGPTALCFELGGPDSALRFNITVGPDDMARYGNMMQCFREQLDDALTSHRRPSFVEAMRSGAYRIADDDD